MGREVETDVLNNLAEKVQRFPEHWCIDHLRHRTNHVVETHGLDCPPYEEYDEEWDECKVCCESFDEVDLVHLVKEAQARAEREASEEQFCDYMEYAKTKTEDCGA